MDATGAVRSAVADDHAAFVRTLTEAFTDDRLMRWVFPDDLTRPERLEALWSYVVPALDLTKGWCTTVSAHDGVALWRAPGDPGDPGYWERNGPRMAADLEGETERMGMLAEVMDAHHPHDRDHWYLPAVGVRPAAQGRGLGGALLTHRLAEADEHGHGAYLEATTVRSRALYARFGFEVLDEIAAPGGPTFWPMWREPGAPTR